MPPHSRLCCCGYHVHVSAIHRAVFAVAVTSIAVIAATAGAGLAAPALIGRNLTVGELVAVAAAFAAEGWALTASRRRRERKRLLGMRDSALW